MLRFLFYLLYPIPQVLVVIWAFSFVALGLGFAIPYALLADLTPFGFWRIAIFGTLTNIVGLVAVGTIMWIDTKYEYNYDRLLTIASIEIVLIGVISVGYKHGWNW